MNKINFNELEEEYLNLGNGVLYDTTDLIKSRILSLPEHEKRIMLLYIELGSFRKVSKIIGVSHTKIIYTIRKIQQKIIKTNS